MKNNIAWLITDNNITVNYNGQTHIVPRTDPLADKLISAVKEKRLEEIPDLVSASKRIESFSKGNFLVKDGQIFINGVLAPKVLGDKIVSFSNEGLPYEPLVKFAENLQNNPSYRAVNELFQFLEKNNHPITENGYFIAYKRVRNDYKDIYTGTIDNSVGTSPRVPRNMVDEDPTRTCSQGLHVANWDYAANIYSRVDNDLMLEVEVNPADVVAVPVDYNQAKMRVCGYNVLGVMDQEHSSDLSLRVVNQERFDALTDSFSNEENYRDCLYCGADLYDSPDGVGICSSCDDDEEEEHCDGCDEDDEDDCDCPECNDCDCEECESDKYPWKDEIL